MIKIVSSLQYPEQSKRSLHTLAQEIKGFVSCSICSAVYTPSQSHESLLQAPTIALESAFMSMCHFCFRCRRPSCPNCWDEVHGICGACVQEVQLPFRVEGASLPLNKMLLVSSRQALTSREHMSSAPLICVCPGRFQDGLPLPSDILLAESGKPMMVESEIQAQQLRSEGPGLERYKPELTQLVQSRKVVGVGSSLPEGQGGRKSWALIARRVERVLTAVVFVLLVIAALIAAASLSEQANTFIATTLQVDIRAEIAYLLQLIQHLH